MNFVYFANFFRRRIKFQTLRDCCQIRERFKKHKMPKAIAVNTKWGKGRKKEDERKLSFHLDETLIRCEAEEEWRNWTEFWTALMFNDSCRFNNCALSVCEAFEKKNKSTEIREVFSLPWASLELSVVRRLDTLWWYLAINQRFRLQLTRIPFYDKKKRFPIRIFC